METWATGVTVDQPQQLWTIYLLMFSTRDRNTLSFCLSHNYYFFSLHVAKLIELQVLNIKLNILHQIHQAFNLNERLKVECSQLILENLNVFCWVQKVESKLHNYRKVLYLLEIQGLQTTVQQCVVFIIVPSGCIDISIMPRMLEAKVIICLYSDNQLPPSA